MMSQLEPDTISQFSSKDLAYQKTFLHSQESQSMLGRIYKRLEIMEVEGQQFFKIFKSPLPLKDRPRTDKIFLLQLAQIDRVKELQDLADLLR